MNYRSLTDADLAEFGKNIVKRLATHEVAGLPDALQDELAAAIGPLNSEFDESVESCVRITAAKQSTVAGKNGLRVELVRHLSALHNFLIAGDCPRSSFVICDLTFRKHPSTVVPNDPDHLVAFVSAPGVNQIAFEGNNKYGAVTYEIYRRSLNWPQPGVWSVIALINKQSYQDSDLARFGQYEYRVRAVAAKSASNYSNTAIV